MRELGWIAGVDDIDKLDAFDDASVPDVEAGDDAFGQHGFAFVKSCWFVEDVFTKS
jgi:hypothetical protein